MASVFGNFPKTLLVIHSQLCYSRGSKYHSPLDCAASDAPSSALLRITHWGIWDSSKKLTVAGGSPVRKQALLQLEFEGSHPNRRRAETAHSSPVREISDLSAASKNATSDARST